MLKNILGAAVGAMALFSLSTAQAGPVAFNVSSGGFVVGSGYGTGSGQLDVNFINLVVPGTSFSLNLGDTQSFIFGRARLNETCINPSIFCGGIGGLFTNETDNLGVTANLTFASPLAATVSVVAVTGAFTGPVNPTFLIEGGGITDFFINFAPVVVSFGVGGSFIVDIGDMFFAQTGAISNAANVTLTAVPVPVPEPASLALFGAGLLGLGLVRRRAARRNALA